MEEETQEIVEDTNDVDSTEEEIATGFGSLTPNKENRQSNPNIKWIGAKFDLTDETDARVHTAATKLMNKYNMSLKKLVAECVLQCKDL